MKIKQKIGVIFSILFAALLGLTYILWWSLNELSWLEKKQQFSLGHILTVEMLDAKISRQIKETFDIIITTKKKEVTEKSNKDEMREFKQQQNNILRLFKQWKKRSAEELAFLQKKGLAYQYNHEINNIQNEIKQIYLQILDHNQIIQLRAAETNNENLLMDAYVAIDTLFELDLVQLLEKSISGYNQEVDAAQEKTQSFTSMMKELSLYIIFIISIILAIAIFMTNRVISTPIIKLKETLEDFAHGDFDASISSITKDEIGDLAATFNNMVLQLNASKRQSEAINQDLIRARDTLECEADKSEQLIKQLEDKNTELERFTYTVSHDLKSPLVTVKGFIGLLKQDIKQGDTERIEGDILQIAHATDKMALLLEDLLELSRIGRMVNKGQNVFLTNLFEDALLMVGGHIEESAAQINIQNDMPLIFADKQRMTEVAQNLLDNAIKFRRPDVTPKIEVTARIRKNYVECCVSDNGIGINAEYQTQIFGLFDRLDPSFEGTGIGLALVKRIMEVHNGEVKIKSEGEGKGAEFCFSLPQYNVQDDKE